MVTVLSDLTCNAEERRKALQKEENAPSIEENRTELRSKGLDYARQRLAIARQLRVHVPSIHNSRTISHRGLLQDITKASINDNHKATVAGLEFLQIAANIDSLEELIKTHNTEYQTVMQEYNAGN